MPGIRLRRIELKVTPSDGASVYTIRPSFVLLYMIGYTDEVADALFLRQGVPVWALTHVFGRDDKYWYRLKTSLGRNGQDAFRETSTLGGVSCLLSQVRYTCAILA